MSLAILSLGVAASKALADECNPPHFAAAPTVSVGGPASGVAAADFDGDGKLDLAAVGGTSSVKVMLNLGNGNYSAPTNFAAGSGTSALSAADFNRDGRVDLAVSNQNNSNVSILLGVGNGAFAAPVNYAVGQAPQANAVGDFNGDGAPDIAVVNPNSANISVLLNSGNGTFANATNFSAGPQPFGVTVGDFNSDGKADLGVASGGGAWILFGRGDGTYAPAVNIFNSSVPMFGIGAGDLNRDGHLDIAIVGGQGPGIVLVALGNGMGTFGNVVTYPTGAESRAVIFKDLDADGYDDLAVANRDSDTVSILFGAASGNITRSVNYVPGDGPVSLASGDLNGNGKLDLAVANVWGQNVALMFGGAAGSFDLPRTRRVKGANGALLGDWNHDGHQDLAFPTWSSGEVGVAFGVGDGTFAEPTYYAAGTTTARVLSADLNNDGRDDLVVLNSGSENLSVLINQGGGTFSRQLPDLSTGGTSPGSLVLADFTGDGNVDLLVSQGNFAFTGALNLFSGNGNGSFVAKGTFSVPSSTGAMRAADFNNDGKLDVVVADVYTSSISVLLNNGNNGFAAPTSFHVGDQPTSIAIGDFNKDGKIDLAVAHTLSSFISVVLNIGNGNFAAAVNYPTSSSPISVVTSDFDSDGNLDLATDTGRGVVIFTGNGAGIFSPVAINAGSQVVWAAGDLNEDGKPDLVQASGTEVVTMLNDLVAKPTFKFVTSTLSVNEGAIAALISVRREGDVTSAGSVQINTVDDPSAVPCSTVNGSAYARCDYATTIETVNFAPNEKTKIVAVPIIDDAHVEGAETFRLRLSTPGGGILCNPVEITVTVFDNDTAGQSNPIFSDGFFVRQQYLDFLSREPEQSGFDAWLGVLNRCPDVNNVDPASSSAGCDRITVSSSFFGSNEFQLKGLFVFRFYKVAFDRLPSYDEITPDMRSVTGQVAAEVFQKKAAFATAFTNRQEFTARYAGLSNASYVSELMSRYNLTAIQTIDPGTPDGSAKVILTTGDLTSGLNNGFLTRSQVLRAVADSDQVFQMEFNKAFVAMQYYGYMRRTPETDGYQAWLNYLNAHPTDYRTMVNGFMNSSEYRLRFGSVQ